MDRQFSQPRIKLTSHNSCVIAEAPLPTSSWRDHVVLASLIVVFWDMQNNKAFWCDYILVECHGQRLVCGSYFLAARIQLQV